MQLDDVCGDHQPDAGVLIRYAAILRKRAEQSSEDLLGNPLPGVSHPNMNIPLIMVQFYRESSPVWHFMNGIQEQIGKYLLQLRRISF